MNKKVFAVVAILALCAVMALPGPANAQQKKRFFGIATGGVGGVYYLESVYKLTLSKKVAFRQKPESRIPGENRDPVFEMVPDLRRDGVWMPRFNRGMTEKEHLKTGFK